MNNILKFPKLILLGIVLLTILFSGFATKLEIDASADTLLLDGDKDLAVLLLVR